MNFLNCGVDRITIDYTRPNNFKEGLHSFQIKSDRTSGTGIHLLSAYIWHNCAILDREQKRNYT